MSGSPHCLSAASAQECRASDALNMVARCLDYQCARLVTHLEGRRGRSSITARGEERPRDGPAEVATDGGSGLFPRTVDLRHHGFTDIVAISTTPGPRITEVNRLLEDLY